MSDLGPNLGNIGNKWQIGPNFDAKFAIPGSRATYVSAENLSGNWSFILLILLPGLIPRHCVELVRVIHRSLS